MEYEFRTWSIHDRYFRDIYNFPIRVGYTDAIHALKYTFRLAYVFGRESDIFTCCRVDTFQRGTT